MSYQLLSIQHRRNTRGFTRIDLLLVVIVLSVALALVLPACGSYFDSGRQLQCSNNMQQIAKSCAVAQATYSSFPPGVVTCSSDQWHYRSTGKIPCQGPNWISSVFQFTDQALWHESMILCMKQNCTACTECPPWTAKNVAKLDGVGVGTQTRPIFRCPSDSSVDDASSLTAGDMPGLSKGNYAGCFGADFYKPSSRRAEGIFRVVPLPRIRKVTGVSEEGKPFEKTERGFFDTCSGEAKGMWKIGWGMGARSSSIQDGAATTILLSEVLASRSASDGRGAWMWPGMGGSAFSAKNRPNSPDPDRIELCDTSVEVGRGAKCEKAQGAMTCAAARSRHVGGLNVSFADTHTVFSSNDIDIEIWQDLSTARGGEIIDSSKLPE